LNDLLQSVLPAVYPILKTAYRLDFGQIGLIPFTNTEISVPAAVAT